MVGRLAILILLRLPLVTIVKYNKNRMAALDRDKHARRKNTTLMTLRRSLTRENTPQRKRRTNSQHDIHHNMLPNITPYHTVQRYHTFLGSALHRYRKHHIKNHIPQVSLDPPHHTAHNTHVLDPFTYVFTRIFFEWWSGFRTIPYQCQPWRRWVPRRRH